MIPINSVIDYPVIDTQKVHPVINLICPLFEAPLYCIAQQPPECALSILANV